MKMLSIATFCLMTTASFAGTSIDKCVDDALEGARNSLATNENLDSRKLYIAEKGMLINDDAQYLKTRAELELLCRRLYIDAVDIGE